LSWRIGLGFDIHRLAEGRTLWLGGLKIPFSAGLLGHSDGDCLVHALIDALLGALGEGDIGQHFPDTDENYAGISSLKLLRQVKEFIRRREGKIENIDAVIIAEAPRLNSYFPQMKSVLAGELGLSEDRINLKAKTHEQLGPLGAREAIAAWVVVLVELPEG